MENKNRGSNIFLGVIGVATLIVAIIGATFAFFSAQTNSANNAINTGSTSLSLGYEDDKDGIKTNLIPAYDNIALLGAQKESNQCVDDNNNNICSVYEFTIGNPSATTAQKVYGSIEITTFDFNNLYFRLYDITDNDDYTVEVIEPTNIKTAANSTNTIKFDSVKKEGTTLDVTLIPSPSESVTGGSFDINKPSTFGTATGTDTKIGNIKKYRMVIWLRDIGEDQAGNVDSSKNDTNKSFVAGIKYTTASGTSGVTGVIGATTGQNFGEE